MAGPVTAVYWIRRAAALAGNEKTGNAVGTILTAFLLPFILIIVCLCGMMDAAADHNRAAVEWCFEDGAIPATMTDEFAGHITQMRACFAVLDGAVGKLNAELEEGSVPLRANRVKADFFALNFGVPFPVSWTVKMKKKQKETQDILSYHTQAAGCSDKARAKASGGRQPIEECGRTGL